MTTLADLLGPERTTALRESIAAKTGRNTEEILMNQPTHTTTHGAETCTCAGKGAKGFTRRDDGMWVHATCMNPTREYLTAVTKGERETLAQASAVPPALPTRATQAPVNPVQPPVQITPVQITLPEPCGRCGWQYDDATLAAAARGEMRLDPTPTHACRPARPTSTAQVDIDPRSEALLQAACSGCGDDILVNPQVPAGQEHLTRVFMCPDCAKEYLRGKSGQVLSRQPSQPKPVQPKPVQPTVQTPVQTENTQPKEPVVRNDTILSTLSDAELGRLMRQQMQAQATPEVVERRESVKQAVAARVSADEQAKTVQREARQSAEPLAAFVVDGSLTVPALDLSQVADLNETVSAKLRSPYNKARFRLLNEGPLPKPGDPRDVNDHGDAMPTTYADLAREHVRLTAVAAQKAAERAAKAAEPKPAKPAQPQQQMVAAVDMDLKAKVDALVEVLGVDRTEAALMVLNMGA